MGFPNNAKSVKMRDWPRKNAIQLITELRRRMLSLPVFTIQTISQRRERDDKHLPNSNFKPWERDPWERDPRLRFSLSLSFRNYLEIFETRSGIYPSPNPTKWFWRPRYPLKGIRLLFTASCQPPNPIPLGTCRQRRAATLKRHKFCLGRAGVDHVGIEAVDFKD